MSEAKPYHVEFNDFDVLAARNWIRDYMSKSKFEGDKKRGFYAALSAMNVAFAEALIDIGEDDPGTILHQAAEAGIGLATERMEQKKKPMLKVN